MSCRKCGYRIYDVVRRTVAIRYRRSVVWGEWHWTWLKPHIFLISGSERSWNKNSSIPLRLNAIMVFSWGSLIWYRALKIRKYEPLTLVFHFSFFFSLLFSENTSIPCVFPVYFQRCKNHRFSSLWNFSVQEESETNGMRLKLNPPNMQYIVPRNGWLVGKYIYF